VSLTGMIGPTHTHCIRAACSSSFCQDASTFGCRVSETRAHS
jgi:hypothetical protein